MSALRLGSFLRLVVAWGTYVVGCQRKYLEAGVLSSSDGHPVWHVRSMAPARVCYAGFSIASGFVWYTCTMV